MSKRGDQNVLEKTVPNAPVSCALFGQPAIGDPFAVIKGPVWERR